MPFSALIVKEMVVGITKAAICINEHARMIFILDSSVINDDVILKRGGRMSILFI